MSLLIRKMLPKRLLYIQLLFTALAFLLMVSLSYIFMKNIVLVHLVKNTESMLAYERTQIGSTIMQSRITLDGVSRTVRNMIMRDSSADDIQSFISDISKIRLNWQNVSSFHSLYGYFETLPGGPVYIGEYSYTNLLDGFVPEEFLWYQNAVAANGEIASSMSHERVSTGELILTYSRCIYDDEGRQLGVVCLDIRIDEMGQQVVEMAQSLGGHGMLICEHFIILAHENQVFVGKQMRDVPTEAAPLEDYLREGIEISEYPINSYKGEPAVAFFRKLENGWYLGIIVPKGPYYQSVTDVTYTLILLGLILALILMSILISVDSARNRSDEENRQKSAFLANMSHEIRTPMNAILGITEMQLHDTTLMPKTREALDKIYNSGDLLLGIVNDILDMSKIEAGKMELIPTKYEIASFITDTVALNIMRFGSKPIEFELTVDENMPSTLFGDELRIKQVLNNLISNSFKYTVKGTIRLSISAETSNDKSEESEVTLVLTISDTGIGMSVDQLNQLFEEYARFNMEANRTAQGTGLGMSITQNLVRMMNGKISVDSILNKGTVFTVRIPQKRTDEGVIGKELAESLQNFRIDGIKQRKRAQIVFEPMPYGKILIVDDVESNLYVATGLMVPYGMKIDTVMSGFEAIEKIKEGNVYDIVFMDHMMPKMDGMEATNIIRKLGYDNPIIALTANAMAGQADVFLANGFDDFISKPIDIRQLNAILKKYVRNKQPPEVIDAAHQQINGNENEYTDGMIQPSVDPHLAEVFVRDASKAVATLESIYEKREAYEDDDIKMFTINVHGMKSALALINELELSAVASKLEQAGRKKSIDVISAETPAFLNNLRKIIEELTPDKRECESIRMDAQDFAYLREKLLVVQDACSTYDKKTAKAAISELRQKTWPYAVEELLGTVAEHLLHSNFEEVARVSEEIIKSCE